MNKDDTIRNIVQNSKTIAVVGFSSNHGKAGYYVPAYLNDHGYKIYPVNPHIENGLGMKAYPDLDSLPEKPDLVLIFRRSSAVPPFVNQAIEIGAKAVWMQLGIINIPAADKARAAGLDVVMDACMMVEHRRCQAYLV
jgi:predicted CoA-binding protein